MTWKILWKIYNNFPIWVFYLGRLLTEGNIFVASDGIQIKIQKYFSVSVLYMVMTRCLFEGWLETNNILSKDFKILVSFLHNFTKLFFFFYLFQLFWKKKLQRRVKRYFQRSNCWGFVPKKIKTQTRFISETTPGFLWAQIELKKNLILNKDIHTLLLHIFQVLGQKG